MKKTMAAVLLGVASTIFGQTVPTLTLNGAVNTGLAAQFNGKDKAQVGLWDDQGTEFKPGGRFKLTGKGDLNGSGAAFDLRADGLTQGSNTLILKSAYAYTNYGGNLLYSQVGIVSETSNRPKDDMAASFTKEVPGAILVVKPLDGLQLNVATVKIFDSSSPQTSGYSNNFTNFADAGTAVGGLFNVKGAGQVMGEAYFAAKNNVYSLQGAYAAGQLVAVTNLDLWVGVNVSNINNGQQAGITAIDQTLSYGLADLGLKEVQVGLVVYEVLYGSDNKTNGGADALTTSFMLKPWVSYAMDGGLTPKLEVSYISGAEASDLGSQYKAGNTNSFDPLYKPSANEGDVNKVATFSVSPSLGFAVSKNQSVSFGLNYTASVGSKKVYYLGSAEATSLTTLLAQYKFSF